MLVHELAERDYLEAKLLDVIHRREVVRVHGGVISVSAVCIDRTQGV